MAVSFWIGASFCSRIMVPGTQTHDFGTAIIGFDSIMPSGASTFLHSNVIVLLPSCLALRVYFELVTHFWAVAVAIASNDCASQWL